MTVEPVDRPAGGGFRRDPPDLGFRHAGVVLEFEGRELAAFVAADSGKGDHRADARERPQARHLGRHVEAAGLDANRDGSHG